MDKFVTVTKTTALSVEDKGKGRGDRQFKYNPYPIPKAKERQVEARRDKKRTEKILAPLREAKLITSTATLNKQLLNTLKDESNPITHSNIGQNSGHVDSCATGHQRSDGRRPTTYSRSRSSKLDEQRVERGKDVNGVLSGTKIYVGGYLAGTTDIEMKRIVTLAGGKIVNTAAGATHIVTSQGMSGSKTHKHLHSNSRNKCHIVTPEWVSDSISLGKRKQEWDYRVIKDNTTYLLDSIMRC
ncbi:hypothetical protein BU17DRAFT_37415 [Hysterangium stoloniferum]|nr:hypothetical protein BU17DRAFT_37415 [Hysterangium stoloniferum]